TLEEVFDHSKIDPWFLIQIQELIEIEESIRGKDVTTLDANTLRQLKRKGFSDRRIAALTNSDEYKVRAHRHSVNVRPVYKRVDSCAAEFSTSTAYMYSSYDEECESQPTDRDKIMVLGGGPNRIGQGIEFDYCCVHAALAMRDDGYETIMVNCNPETVSTDYDTSDRLYFEPLTLEDVLEVVAVEKPKGVIVQYGGQTPLKLARDLEAAGVPIIGTSPDAIDMAEDRERFQQMVNKLGLLQPPNATARTEEQALELARELGFPLVVRPSYVLGGRAMEIVYSEEDLKRYMTEAVSVSNDSPVLLDRFLDDAVELDVDAICDGEKVFIGGIMQHIEQAGVHSGDSACSLPPYNLAADIQDKIKDQVRAMAMELGVVGLMNTQFAVKDDEIYIIEVNPRASRTVPFVSKAIGMPLAKIAARCMVGQKLSEQGVEKECVPEFYSVKEAVFPFVKFPGVDTILGPEMKSTGEVMGVGRDFGEAFAKAQLGAGVMLPEKGKVFISVRDADKERAIVIAKELTAIGFKIVATDGTAAALTEHGIENERVNKVSQGRPHSVDLIINNEIQFVINTAQTKQSIADSQDMRKAALQQKVTYTTTIAGAYATTKALARLEKTSVTSLQELHKELAG
ncbi:MAG: carbamoyl-phosphate synthase large subunit, partial [Gammaproteobacteria bacterium]|nr:carbamoyl-phosphate synthase large subunit [Gammaproteobacteria bacterium]